jgi:hypothetical protein
MRVINREVVQSLNEASIMTEAIVELLKRYPRMQSADVVEDAYGATFHVNLGLLDLVSSPMEVSR